MTDLLERAIKHVRNLPNDAQDAFARVLLQLVGDEPQPYRLSPEEIADLDAAEDEVSRGQFAEDGEVSSVLSRYRS